MPLPTTFTGWSSLSIIASPHLAQMRLVIWLSSSRFASDARAVFESSPFFGIDVRPLSPVFSAVYLNSCGCCDNAQQTCPHRVANQYTIRGNVLSNIENKVPPANIPALFFYPRGFAHSRRGSQLLDSLALI